MQQRSLQAIKAFGRLVAGVCFAAMSFVCVHAESLQVPTELNTLRTVGAGRLTYYGFHVYDASTWSTDGQLASDGKLSTPYALQLRYARDIDASDLIDKTGDAWRELNLFDARCAQWLTQLKTMWPDVKKDDVLVLYVEADGTSRFFYNGRLIGEFTDTGFAASFAAIWLDSNAEFQPLRRKLLGLSS